MACPNFIPGKDICAYLLEKFGGKEDLAKKGCESNYRSENCAYERNNSFFSCPLYKEQQQKLK